MEPSSLWREWAGRRNAWGRGKNTPKSRKTGQNTGRLEIEIPPWPRGLSFCEGISCLCQTDRRQGSYLWQDWLITIVEHLHSKLQAIIKTLLHFKMEFPLPRYHITSVCSFPRSVLEKGCPLLTIWVNYLETVAPILVRISLFPGILYSVQFTPGSLTERLWWMDVTVSG